MAKKLMDKTASFLNRFHADKSGNVAVMFCGTIFAVMAGVGLAVDYIGMQRAQAELQGQVDAAVLAVVLSGEDDLAKQRTFAREVMIQNGYSASLPEPNIIYAEAGDLTVSAQAPYNVTVMGLFGENTKTVQADASSLLAQNDIVELALVLDTTDSMGQDGKIEALRSATNGLIESVSSAPAGSIKIALVPYANYVNVDSVGMNNRNASWTDIPADYSEIVTKTDRIKISDGYCRGTYTGIHEYVSDGVRKVQTDRCTDWVDSVYQDNGTKDVLETYDWRGCVTSRNNGLHMKDGSYGVPVPGILDKSCSDPIVPLTEDFDGLQAAVSNLDVGQNTYIPAGLMWGQRVLSSGDPYSESQPLGPDGEVRQMMVVMTDGNNSMALNADGTHASLNPLDNAADALRVQQTDADTSQLCENIKKENIEVFTIAFSVDNAQTRQMLTECASSAGHYFRAESSSQLASVFNAISTQIFAVRITE